MLRYSMYELLSSSEGRHEVTYYCTSCKRLTDGYDLWPNGECVCCYTATEDLLDTDAKMLTYKC